MSGTSLLRRPRVQVLANGVPVAGVRNAYVTSCGYYAADQFSVSLALGADPTWTASEWSAQSSVMLEVQIGFVTDGASEGAVGWASLIIGMVDSIEIDLPGQVVGVRGRDLTATLISARTQETFANQTSSEIATTLALRNYLAPQVTATTTLVGNYYELEHDRLTLNQFSRATTEWDLLVFLAHQEGFDVFVQGQSLYFQPANLSTQPTVLRANSTAGGPANVTELRLERSLALGNVEVTVKSWNSRQQSAYAQTASSASLAGAGSGPTQSYVVIQPNLLADQAQSLAQNWLTTLTQHELVVTAVMPGELSLNPRGIVAIEGTGTAFDQNYVIDTIDRRVSFGGGFVQHVRAKSASSAASAV